MKYKNMALNVFVYSDDSDRENSDEENSNEEN